jgi:hypothetical protein
MTRYSMWLLAPLGAALVLLVLWRGRRRLPAPLRGLALGGLTLLVALGFSPLSMVAASEGPSQESLEKRREWKRLSGTWKEAEEIASGARGEYPFDRAGKEKLLRDLDAAAADVDALVKDSALDSAEGELLKKQLPHLRDRVASQREQETRNAKCYDMMVVDPLPPTLARLREQLPLLQKIAAAKTLHPDVLRKLSMAIEADIQGLSRPSQLKQDKKIADEATALETQGKQVLAKALARLGEKAP